MLVLLNALQAGNRSGTGMYTEQLARRLPGLAEDVEVTVAWPRDVPPVAGLERAAGCRVLLRGGGGWLQRVRYDQFGCRRDAKALDADLVHYPANVGSLRAGLRTVVTVHDLSFYHEPRWYRPERALYYRRGVAASVQHAERVITVSEFTAAELTKHLGYPRDRIDVIPNGVDERFGPATDEDQARVRTKYGLPERFILYTGTHEPRKNLVRLIRAWSTIAAQTTQDLVLAGRTGWKTAPIRAEAERSPHHDRIHFPGFIDDSDLPALMTAADVFAYPSLYEGFGIPVAEAMACGTPVLTSNTTSLPEVAGDAAVLVDPLDIDALADGLRRLVFDEVLRSDLRRKGLERAQGYSWECTARETLDTYRKTLDRG